MSTRRWRSMPLVVRSLKALATVEGARGLGIRESSTLRSGTHMGMGASNSQAAQVQVEAALPEGPRHGFRPAKLPARQADGGWGGA